MTVGQVLCHGGHRRSPRRTDDGLGLNHRVDHTCGQPGNGILRGGLPAAGVCHMDCDAVLFGDAMLQCAGAVSRRVQADPHYSLVPGLCKQAGHCGPRDLQLACDVLHGSVLAVIHLCSCVLDLFPVGTSHGASLPQKCTHVHPL